MTGGKSKNSALLLIILGVALIGACGALEYRLPRSVLPYFYNITIRPYLLANDADKQFTFEGDVSIDLQAVQTEVQQITLHKDYIDIKSCSIYDADGALVEEVSTERLQYETDTDKLTVPLGKALQVNVNYTLRFNYTGLIRDGLKGLYRSSYVEQGTGDIKWIAVTQLQRIDARVVFPCFDEPDFKAKFQLHISRPKDYNAISNTKLIDSTAEQGDRYLDHFEVTPVMSTYLVAFIVSEYKARGTNDFAVISRPEFYDKTEFSYNVGQRTEIALEKLFQQPYSELGNRMLQFASSPTFPHNGMENWGLIIYSDAILVQEPGYTDGYSDKELTVRIIAHETSHMWFGDSVTFKWWSYFWLNEAFARFYEYFMAHELYPEYELDEQFVVRQVQLIFGTDAVNSTQPMSSPEESIQTPEELGYKFSSIAYAKGASIVRMWRNAMGDTNFDAAISSYLKANHLRNTVPDELFEHLRQHWPAQQYVDLDKFFSDYTEQVGYAMVLVNASMGNQQISLEQRRFLLSPGDGSDAELRYTIPITYTTNLELDFKNLTPSMYFDKIVDQVVLRFDEPIDWIVLNLKQSNYYRVFYDTPLLQQLQLALATKDHSQIVVQNRAQIIDDLFNFARVGMVDYAEVFEFLEYLQLEKDYVPWYAAYEGLARIAPRLTAAELPNFAKYLSDITETVFAKVVQSNDDSKALDVYNRNKQVAWLCKYQHAACNSQVLATLSSLEQENSKPIPDYRETLYCAAARAGEYAKVLQLYRAETFEIEKQKLWRAASCTRHYQAHYEKEILGNDTTVAMKIAGLEQLYQQNPENVSPVFEMLTKNITQLAEALDSSWSETANVLSGLADYFTTQAQQKQLDEFIAAEGTLFGSSISTLQKATQTVSSNLDWAEQRLSRLVNYLGQRNGAVALQLLYGALLLPVLSLVLNL